MNILKESVMKLASSFNSLLMEKTKDFQKSHQAAKNSSDIRVDRIKTRIPDRSFHVDSHDLAKKILKDVIWDEKEKKWMKNFYTLYGQQLAAFDNIVTASQYWLAYDTFLKICPPPSPDIHILDWGCGTGHFSYFLLEAGFITDSFSLNNKKSHDLGEIQIFNFLKSKFNQSFRYRTGTDSVKLPYADNSFDAVVSIGVLEHVREFGGDEIKSLMEIHRILKKGGIFFCYHFPNKFSWIDAIAKRIPSKL